MKFKKSPIYAAFIAFIILFIGFSWFIIKNDSIFVIYGDRLEQQYPFIVGFWQKMHELDFNLYEWSNGLGASTFSYIFYNLLSPFNLIFLFFPKEWIKNLILYIDIIKMITIAALSCLWLDKIFDNSKVAISGSLMLTFSGWILFYFQYHFLDAFIFYPLILYYAECFIQNKKKKGLVLTIACLTAVNYYFMYMLVPFLWLYALFRYLIYHKNAKLKDVLADGGKFLALSLLGMGLSGIVLCPCIYLVSMLPRLSQSQEMTFFIGKKDLFRIITSIFSPVFSNMQSSNFILEENLTYQGWAGGAPLYTSIFSLVLMPNIIKLKDKRKRNFLFLFIGIVCIFMISPFFYKLFQATIDTRFFYMFTILAIYCNCEVLNEHAYLKGKFKYILIFLAVLTFYFFLLISHQFQFSTTQLLIRQCKVQFVLFIILFIGIFLLTKKGIKVWMYILSLEMIFCMLLFVKYNDFVDSDDFYYEADEIVESIKNNDDGFYRVLKADSKCNDAFMNQVNGVNFYSTLYGFEQDEFLARLKQASWAMNVFSGKYRIYNLIGAKYWYSLNNNSNIPFGSVSSR